MKLFSQLQPTNCNKGGFFSTYNIANTDAVVMDYYLTPQPTAYPSTSPPQSSKKYTPDNTPPSKQNLIPSEETSKPPEKYLL